MFIDDAITPAPPPIGDLRNAPRDPHRPYRNALSGDGRGLGNVFDMLIDIKRRRLTLTVSWCRLGSMPHPGPT
jgi:hypothetical protein